MPTTVVALAILIVAVLPGSMYTWAFERQASAFGVTFADRTLRFLAVSMLFHLALGWPEYLLYRVAFVSNKLDAGQFAAAWAGALVLIAVPATIGTVLGGLYASRNTRIGWDRLRKRLSAEQERLVLRTALGRDPAPRAWDDLFSERPTVYLRIRTADGAWLAGRFAEESYAGGFPHEADLLLEEAWEIDDEGVLGDEGLGYSVYIPAEQIAWLEVVYEQEDEEEPDA